MLTFLDKYLKNFLQVAQSDWGQQHHLSDGLKEKVVKCSIDNITVANVLS